MPTNYCVWYKTISAPLYIFSLPFHILKICSENKHLHNTVRIQFDSWLFTVEPTKTKRTSQMTWYIWEVSVLAPTKYTTHTTPWKTIFELASTAIAMSVVLQLFQISNKNSQDLEKSSNGSPSYCWTVCRKGTQLQGHGSYIHHI